MATWVDKTLVKGNYGNIYLYLEGGYANISRNGNTVTGNIGIRFTMRANNTDGANWTYNSIVGSYDGVKRYAQKSTGSTHTTNSGVYYANSTDPSDGYQCTTEVTPWSFSRTVSGSGAGTLSFSISAGWKDYAGSTGDTFTFSVPYPKIPPSTVTLQLRQQNSSGGYGDYYTWKTLSVEYGDSYSQTWSKTGFDDVTFSGSNVTSGSTVQKTAYRKKYTVSLYVKKQNIDGSYPNSGTKWKDITVLYEASYNDSGWSETGFNGVTFSGSNVTGSGSNTQNASRILYYFDLNGYTDGSDSGGISGYGTVSITFNDGTGTLTGLTDHYAQHRYGTTYTISNIVPTIGHTYKGVKEGSLTGTITGATSTRLTFVTNDMKAKDSNGWHPGDTYIKVNGAWKRASQVYIKVNNTWKQING